MMVGLSNRLGIIELYSFFNHTHPFMYQSNRSLNIPPPLPGIPWAFDVFSCPGEREFDELSLPGGREFDHYL